MVKEDQIKLMLSDSSLAFEVKKQKFQIRNRNSRMQPQNQQKR